MYLVIDGTYSSATGFGWDEYPMIFQQEEDAIQHVTKIMNDVEGESRRYIEETVIPTMRGDDFEYHTYCTYLMQDRDGEPLPIPNTDKLKPTIKQRQHNGRNVTHTTEYSIIIVRGFIARRTIEIYPIEVTE